MGNPPKREKNPNAPIRPMAKATGIPLKSKRKSKMNKPRKTSPFEKSITIQRTKRTKKMIRETPLGGQPISLEHSFRSVLISKNNENVPLNSSSINNAPPMGTRAAGRTMGTFNTVGETSFIRKELMANFPPSHMKTIT